MPLTGKTKCRRLQHLDCICALILQFRCQLPLPLRQSLCRSCSEWGEQPTVSFFSLSSELRWGVAMGFLPPQLCCFSHGTVLILQSEGWHHRNNIHLAPAKNSLATCKIITKLPLICVCFLTVEFGICSGGAQTALDACTQLPVMVTPEKRDKAAERKESSWGNEHSIWTNPSHQALQGGAGCWVQHILRTLRCAQQGPDELAAEKDYQWQHVHVILHLPPFSTPSSRLVPLQYQPTHTRNLFSLVSYRLDRDLCCSLYLTRPRSSSLQSPWSLAVTELAKRWECNCTLQGQSDVIKLHQLEKWLLSTGSCFICGLV